MIFVRWIVALPNITEGILLFLVGLLEPILLLPFDAGDWVCVKLYGKEHMDVVNGDIPKEELK